MTQHDNSYKLLFSHREMVRDLLAGFVHEPWLDEIDLGSLEKVSGSYVADDLRDREDDIVWRVRFKGRWLYLYILLEFQSTVDAFMAVRILTYLGLLYQDICLARGKLSGLDCSSAGCNAAVRPLGAIQPDNFPRARHNKARRCSRRRKTPSRAANRPL